MISLEKLNILTHLQKLPKMWAIWAKQLFLQALKSFPKSNNLPNLVTLNRNHSRFESLRTDDGGFKRKRVRHNGRHFFYSNFSSNFSDRELKVVNASRKRRLLCQG